MKQCKEIIFSHWKIISRKPFLPEQTEQGFQKNGMTQIKNCPKNKKTDRIRPFLCFRLFQGIEFFTMAVTFKQISGKNNKIYMSERDEIQILSTPMFRYMTFYKINFVYCERTRVYFLSRYRKRWDKIGKLCSEPLKCRILCEI